ncbi:MAG: 2-dehydro-3-deoxygalactonokinase [Pseudomonadota bacterium]|nr:2-dehydro-3-deoxygalactonokinase [Pseudomonadota bacterium]
MNPDWVAVDWGTTNMRAFAMSDTGEVLGRVTSDRGMGTLTPAEFSPTLEAALADWALADTVPVIACGMVGARQGWVEAEYRAVPCAPVSTTATRAPASRPVLIVPGLSQSDPADIMRGEETQIAGYLLSDPDFAGTLCLPGSHTKWAAIDTGRIERFRTVMTGETFSALTKHTILRLTMDDGWDDDTFRAAVSEGFSNPAALTTALFALRSTAMLHGVPPGTAAARASGLLIGMELAHCEAFWRDRSVVLIGADHLSQRYATALDTLGNSPITTDADTCTLAGLKAAWAELKDTL